MRFILLLYYNQPTFKNSNHQFQPHLYCNHQKTGINTLHTRLYIQHPITTHRQIHHLNTKHFNSHFNTSEIQFPPTGNNYRINKFRTLIIIKPRPYYITTHYNTQYSSFPIIKSVM